MEETQTVLRFWRTSDNGFLYSTHEHNLYTREMFSLDIVPYNVYTMCMNIIIQMYTYVYVLELAESQKILLYLTTSEHVFLPVSVSHNHSS